MTLRARAFAHLGAVTLCCALLPACTPSADASPSPTPPPSSPTAQTSPPETEQQRKERLDFEAAENAYRTFRAEYDRLYEVKGGSGKVTKPLADNAAGPYLRVMLGFLADSKSRGRYTDHGVRIAYVKRGAYSPQELILNTCEDGGQVRVFSTAGKQVSTGTTSKLKLYIRPLAGRWKVWNGDQEVVKKCEA